MKVFYAKVFTIIFFAFVIFLRGFAQNIDSLKKALLTAKGTERLDCLNRLSSVFYYFNEDTGLLYTKQACEEAFKINSAWGKATLLFNTGIIKLYETDYSIAEKYFRQSIPLFQKSGDIHGLGEATMFAAVSLNWESKLKDGIEMYEQSIPYFQKSNDSAEIANALGMIGLAYENKGDYEKSLEFGKRCYRICGANHYWGYLIYSVYWLSLLYKGVGDYETALKYLQEFAEISKANPQYCMSPPDVPVAEIYCLKHNYDSALYYVNPYINFSAPDYAARAVLVQGEIYFMQNKYAKALQNFLPFLNGSKRTPENGELRALLDIVKVYDGMQENNYVLRYAKILLQKASESDARQYVRDAAYFLSNTYERRKQFDSSFYYHKLYTVLRDSIENKQYLFKLADYKDEAETDKKNAEIKLLQKDREINEQQIRKESLLKKFFGSGIIVVILLGLIIVRVITLKRKNEKLEGKHKEVALQQQATELEMQALRAQMNPHFIFNSLNSIDLFILQNDKAKASKYLTKFSRLIRMILNSSANASVCLGEDLEALQLYLELERLRCDEKFSFKINYDPEIDIDFVQIPPLLLQPFAENAIWHGLMNKEDEGHLWINIGREDSLLTYTITDDGIGRKKAAQLKDKSDKHKSMGMKITESRIAMMQKINGSDKSVEIRDLVDANGGAAGTEVILKIPFIQ